MTFTAVNNRGGDDVEVTIVAEFDEVPFVSIMSMDDAIDLILDDPEEAEQFFTDVAEAKRRWDEMMAKG